jgi:hypothetical protein
MVDVSDNCDVTDFAGILLIHELTLIERPAIRRLDLSYDYSIKNFSGKLIISYNLKWLVGTVYSSVMEKQYAFDELKEEIYKAVEYLAEKDFFGVDPTIHIVDGFSYVNVQDTLTYQLNSDGGVLIPYITIIDTQTSQMWQFALRGLLPELDLDEDEESE